MLIDGRVNCIPGLNQWSGVTKAYVQLLGAWLESGENKIVLTPNLKIDGKAAWGFKGLIPDDWVKV